MYNINEFCNILTALRKEKAWTQTYLAEKLMVSPQAVSKWECGIGFPDITLFPEIAQIFDVPIGILFGETYRLTKKGASMTEYTMQFPSLLKCHIHLGNPCRLEFVEDTPDICRIVVKGDPVFLEYFFAETENDTLVLRVKNPCGSDILWLPYDRDGYTGENLVQIYTGTPWDNLDVCVVNYLDLCCSDQVNSHGNPEYVCFRASDTV
ncbi:MAG: helix-turn-helix transcriptional regulator [Clostridia bacterium]|nr:helix-turn-helix transcriptional regulator [Clostridia bacterium]